MFQCHILFITRTGSSNAMPQHDESFQSAQTTIKPRGRGARYILWNIATPNWRPNPPQPPPPPPSRYQFNLPLTLCVPIRTLRNGGHRRSAEPAPVYCYLYSGNYQFAGIHYGIRDGFADSPALATRAETRVNYARLCVDSFFR